LIETHFKLLIDNRLTAKARNISADVVTEIIDDNTEQPLFGLLGPPKVNVLKMNVALDELKN
jgi:K+-transporting ATPase ATPase C chain